MPKDETTKPDAASKGKTKESEEKEHPQDVLRREGLRLFPGAQTQHLDTTEGGVIDVGQLSPVFEEARQHAVRAAAAAADAEYGDPEAENVIFPDDADEANLAREQSRRAAADLPPEVTDRDPNLPDGMGGPYGQGVVPEPDDTSGAAESTSDETKTEDSKTPVTKAPVKTTAAKTTTTKTPSK